MMRSQLLLIVFIVIILAVVMSVGNTSAATGLSAASASTATGLSAVSGSAATGMSVASGSATTNASLPTKYVVVKGDTLFKIGRLYNVNPWAIASANRLANPNLIYVGQTLDIPAGSSYPGPGACGSYYTVRQGDTLFRIGMTYQVSCQRIAAENHISNVNYIQIGQKLFIPCR
jgi:LysM repeat protein